MFFFWKKNNQNLGGFEFSLNMRCKGKLCQQIVVAHNVYVSCFNMLRNISIWRYFFILNQNHMTYLGITLTHIKYSSCIEFNFQLYTANERLKLNSHFLQTRISSVNSQTTSISQSL